MVETVTMAARCPNGTTGSVMGSNRMWGPFVAPLPCGAAPPNTLGRNGGGEQSQRKDHMISHRITQIPLATLPGRGPITQQ